MVGVLYAIPRLFCDPQNGEGSEDLSPTHLPQASPHNHPQLHAPRTWQVRLYSQSHSLISIHLSPLPSTRLTQIHPSATSLALSRPSQPQEDKTSPSDAPSIHQPRRRGACSSHRCGILGGWTRLKRFVRSGLGGRAAVPLGLCGYQGICRLSRVWDVALWLVWRKLGGWLLYRDG